MTRTERAAEDSSGGQVIVLFALALIAIIAAVGLVLDGGSTFAQRRDQQSAADLASLVQPQFAAREISLVSRLPETGGATDLYVAADREKLIQILTNLLGNAAKFTPAHGEVEIRLTRGVRDDEVMIVVRDSGVGIPADKLELIFEPFVQLERSLTMPAEGAGLGLAISRDLARGMGGDLLAESVEGQGATLILTLPRAAAPADR